MDDVHPDLRPADKILRSLLPGIGAEVLLAWGDESVADGAPDHGGYVLGTVLADLSDADAVRAGMRDLRLRRQRKLHWRDEGEKRRAEIAAALSGLPLRAVVVIRSGDAREAWERRRRKCMERLVHELDGCSRLVLESRGPRDDARDRALFEALRRRHGVPPGLHLEHEVGPVDAGLWAADALCGVR